MTGAPGDGPALLLCISSKTLVGVLGTTTVPLCECVETVGEGWGKKYESTLFVAAAEARTRSGDRQPLSARLPFDALILRCGPCSGSSIDFGSAADMMGVRHFVVGSFASAVERLAGIASEAVAGIGKKGEPRGRGTGTEDDARGEGESERCEGRGEGG